MPMDGSWKQEYQYHETQMKQLSLWIFQGPLSSIEALIAFEMYLPPKSICRLGGCITRWFGGTQEGGSPT